MTYKLRQLFFLLVILAVSGLCLWPGVSLALGPGKSITVIVDPGHGGQDGHDPGVEAQRLEGSIGLLANGLPLRTRSCQQAESMLNHVLLLSPKAR